MTQDAKTPKEMKQKLVDSLASPIVRTLDAHGITLDKLAKLLKKELSATEVKTYNDKGQIVYSDPLVAWDIRQRARQDAHKLRGDYPADEHKLSGNLIEPRSPEERKILEDVAKQVAKALRDKKAKP